MKIGILSFPNMTSYGCSLQMYSLYRAVQQAGTDAEIINYQNNHMRLHKHTHVGRSSSPVLSRLRLAATKALHIRQIMGFQAFQSRMVLYPARPIHDASRLSSLAARYDGVICGSDQVWNPHISGADISYFLNFCGSHTRRIAYAPSFGISRLPADFSEQIRPELARFSHLSVREADGVQLVKAMVDLPVAETLDPTFLIPSSEWTALEKPHPLAKGSYIFCFPVRKSSRLLRYSRELAEKRNARLIVVQGNFLTVLRNKDPRISYALDLSPEEWLHLMHHADCIVTNSFHGAAFSIHYQKDFYLECDSNANSRLYHLMELCHLEDRIIGDSCAPWDAHIDYPDVEARLAPARADSLMFLTQAILP